MRATLPVLAALLVTAVPAAASSHQDGRMTVRSSEVVSGPSPYDDACRGPGLAGVEASPQLLPGERGDAPFVVWQQDALHGGGPDIDTDSPGLRSTAGDVGVGPCAAGKPGDLVVAPSVALGPDGSRWVATTVAGSERNAVLLSRQRPGGTWEQRTVTAFDPAVPPLFLLAATVAVDPVDPETVHVAYPRNHFPAGTLAVHRVSRDGGATWSAEHVMSIGPTPLGYDFAEQLVALGGDRLLAVSTEVDQAGMATLASDYATYRDLSQAPIVHRARTSDDGGVTWSDPVRIMTLANGGVRDREEGGTALRSLVRPSVLLGEDGRVHVAAESVAIDGKKTQLLVATSPDGGGSWRVFLAATVNGVALGAAVAEDGTGRLGLSWLDLSADRAGDKTLDAEWRFASSPEGRVWTPSQAISPSFDLRPLAPVYAGDQGALLGLKKGFAAALVTGTGIEDEARPNPSDVVLTTLR